MPPTVPVVPAVANAVFTAGTARLHGMGQGGSTETAALIEEPGGEAGVPPETPFVCRVR